jgi:RHS repeat-associated protein
MVRPFRIQYPEAAYHVMGVALATSSVTVNSQTPYRKGEYFRKEISVSNGSNPAWQSVTVAAPGETSVSGNAYVPKGPEQFAYDADGNLTGDGRWTYVWDAENRLVQMLPTTVITVPDGAKRKLDFVYDYKGRRIQKAVSTWNGTDWTLTVSNRFLYDAWNLVAELNAPNNAAIRTYLWGLDLSGSLQGAGGVGGLVAIGDASKGRHFVSYDGNGNVMQAVASGDGNISAVYEYGPFGEIIRATGPMAKANPFRFSTKYQDEETGLFYYGMRYYNATTGRWLSRDPLMELGGGNLYGMVGNNAVTLFDLLGMASPAQMLQTMDSIFKLLSRINCDCPNESAYLKCLLDELNDAFAKSGYVDAIKQAIGQVEAWKWDVATAGRAGLNSDVAKKLDDALSQLAKSTGGMAEKVNNLRECHNKCIERATEPGNTAVDLYDGDSINAAMSALDAIGKLAGEAGGDAAAPLKPILQWLQWYKKAYNAASKKLDQIGLDGLQNALKTVDDLNMTDCDEISSILGKGGSAPPSMRRNCISKLNSGVGL